MVSEMFRIIGYHIPPNAVSSPDRWEQISVKIINDSIFRKLIICDKLNIPYPPPLLLSFNPIQYTTIGSNNVKEASYDRNNMSRESYINTILDNINSADVRTLVKYLEEKSQCVKFCKAFPNKR